MHTLSTSDPILSACAQRDPNSQHMHEVAPSDRNSNSQFLVCAHGDSDSRHVLEDSDFWHTPARTHSQHGVCGDPDANVCIRLH